MRALETEHRGYFREVKVISKRSMRSAKMWTGGEVDGRRSPVSRLPFVDVGQLQHSWKTSTTSSASAFVFAGHHLTRFAFLGFQYLRPRDASFSAVSRLPATVPTNQTRFPRPVELASSSRNTEPNRTVERTGEYLSRFLESNFRSHLRMESTPGIWRNLPVTPCLSGRSGSPLISVTSCPHNQGIPRHLA